MPRPGWCVHDHDGAHGCEGTGNDAVYLSGQLQNGLQRSGLAWLETSSDRSRVDNSGDACPCITPVTRTPTYLCASLWSSRERPRIALDVEGLGRVGVGHRCDTRCRRAWDSRGS